MRRIFLSRTSVLSGLVGGVALAAMPVAMSMRADGRPGIIMKLNSACGQATECQAAEKYICSKKDKDEIDHKCKSGCGDEM